MQKLLLVIMISISLMAYGQETKQNGNNTIKSSKSFGKGASVVEKIRALNKEKNALKALKPLTIKELQDWLPDNMKGMHKTESTALTQGGITSVNAKYLEEHPEYGIDYGKNLRILIIDGYGEKGACRTSSCRLRRIKNTGNAKRRRRMGGRLERRESRSSY